METTRVALAGRAAAGDERRQTSSYSLYSRDDTSSRGEAIKTLVILAVVLGAGCAHELADLKKPQREQVFTLERDYTRTVVRGLARDKWVEGLRSGVYTLAAEDDEGLYFVGPGRCVVRLLGKYGDEYLATGDAKVELGVMGGHVGFFTGGLWLPKAGVQKPPKLFWEFDPDRAASGGGVIIEALIQGGAGDVLFDSFASETKFLDDLKVIDK